MGIKRKRNYHNCRGFGHITKNCINQRTVGQGRQISYQDNDYNLKEKNSLIVLN